MKATQLLEQQHRKVEAIFEQLHQRSVDPKPLLEELANSLACHMAIEQDIFYPTVRDADPDLIDESFEEHAMAEIALKRLMRTASTDPTFEAKLSTLEELIEHHVDEEEEELFPAVEERMSDTELEALGNRMQQAFAAAEKQGYAALVPQGMAQTSADEARKVASQMQARPNGASPSAR